jgi:hypothetical protein
MVRLVASVFVLAAFGAEAFQLRRDSEGDVVKWKGVVQFTVDEQFGQMVGEPRARQALQAAVKAFDEATADIEVRLTSARVKGMGFDPRTNDNENEVLALTEWPFAARNIAATVVTVNARTNEILDADIAFNLAEWRFRVLEQPGSPTENIHDLQGVFMHELGHAVGLQHEPEVREAVMYPSAQAGELTKRTLSDDDRAGLIALYFAPATPDAPADAAAGCSAVGGSPLALLLGLLALLQREGRRAATRAPRGTTRLALGAAVCALLLAAPTFAQDRGPRVDRLAHGEVSFTRARWLDASMRLIVTEVEVTVRECPSGPCDERVVLRQLGGRIGDIEQYVSHEAPLRVGDGVILAWEGSRIRVAAHLPRALHLPQAPGPRLPR